MNKDIIKNPFFYYAVIPAVLMLWPILVWMVYLPKADKSWDNEKKQYEEAQKVMLDILRIDPERLDYANTKSKTAEFDYAVVFDKITSSCGIASTNYRISVTPARTSKGQKTQTAQVVLNQIDIEKFAKFVSTLQFRWESLQCVDVKLSKIKGLNDAWKVDMNFKYYF